MWRFPAPVPISPAPSLPVSLHDEPSLTTVPHNSTLSLHLARQWLLGRTTGSRVWKTKNKMFCQNCESRDTKFLKSLTFITKHLNFTETEIFLFLSVQDTEVVNKILKVRIQFSSDCTANSPSSCNVLTDTLEWIINLSKVFLALYYWVCLRNSVLAPIYNC